MGKFPPNSDASLAFGFVTTVTFSAVVFVSLLLDVVEVVLSVVSAFDALPSPMDDTLVEELERTEGLLRRWKGEPPGLVLTETEVVIGPISDA